MFGSQRNKKFDDLLLRYRCPFTKEQALSFSKRRRSVKKEFFGDKKIKSLAKFIRVNNGVSVNNRFNPSFNAVDISLFLSRKKPFSLLRRLLSKTGLNASTSISPGKINMLFAFDTLRYKLTYLFLKRCYTLFRRHCLVKKKRRKSIRRFFSSFIFKNKKVGYPKFLKKKYFRRHMSRSIIFPSWRRNNKYAFVRRFSLGFFNFRRSKQKSLSLLRQSVGSSIKFFNCLNRVSNKTEVNHTVLFLLKQYKRNVFRNNLLKSNLKLTKIITLFSTKGNNFTLINLIFKEVKFKRSVLFKRFSVVFKRCLQSIKRVVAGVVVNRRINFIRLSLLVRRFFGIFLRFFFKKKSKKSLDFSVQTKTDILLKFVLRRMSVLTLTSFQKINKIFKLFYLFFETKPWKKSGRTVIVPVPIKSKARRLNLFGHWFKEAVLQRKEVSISKKFINEFTDLKLRQGFSMYKLRTLFRTVRSNRALIRKSKISLV